MPGQGIVRVGVDVCSGHNGFNPRPAISGSVDTFVNGFAVVRVNDPWGQHTDGMTVHQGTSAVGSPTVFVNGLPVMRSLDIISCGSTASMASVDTFAG